MILRSADDVVEPVESGSLCVCVGHKLPNRSINLAERLSLATLPLLPRPATTTDLQINPSRNRTELKNVTLRLHAVQAVNSS
jgi:hypothetical protein